MHTVHLNTVIIKCFEMICPITTENVSVLYSQTQMMRNKHDSKEAIRLRKESESDVASVSVDLGIFLT